MIEIKNLNKYYGKGRSNEIHAVNNVSQSLPASGMVALFGKSGCGKTTFLNIVGGLDRAQSGSVTLCEQRVTPTATDVRNRDIGYIFQNYYLTKNLTVYENVALALRLCGVADEKEIETRTLCALRSVGMEKYRKRLPDNLSGGQQQRVAVARAIVKNPKLILADEPTGNLDEHNTVLVMDLLKEISKNCLVLLVTHEADLVDLYCDKVIELSDGQVVNTYENENTGGYVGKGKNDVYLGDLERSDIHAEGIDIEYFGGDGDVLPRKLRLVSVGGVIYVKAEEGIKLRVLDNSSELTFHEGKFEEQRTEARAQLDPILAKNPTYKRSTGRIYNFKTAFVTGYRVNFGKKKFGRVMLMLVMVLMAIIVVTCASSLGRALVDRQTIQNNYNASMVAVDASVVSPDKLSELLKDADYDNIYVSYGYTNRYPADMPVYIPQDMVECSFEIGNFETFSVGTGVNAFFNRIYSTVLPTTLIEGKRMLAGTIDTQKPNEIVISKALADMAIDALELDFVNDYNDLLYCPCTVSGAFMSTRYIVVGVVNDNSNALYMQDESYAISHLGDGFAGDEGVPVGEIRFNDKDAWLRYVSYENEAWIESLTVGDTLTLYGKKFSFGGWLTGGDASISDDWPTVILNPADLMDLTMRHGESSSIFEFPFAKDYWQDYTYMIHSSHPALLAAMLEDELGDDSVTSPGEMYEYYSMTYGSDIASNVQGVVICLLALALCMYFIMRSTLMKDIKEVGICRAIGVSRKNIVYKYFIESITVFLWSIVPGFAIGSLISMFMMSLSRTVNLNYPPVIAVATFILLFAVTVLCGIIPVMMLLRKTPAQIIAKYDI